MGSEPPKGWMTLEDFARETENHYGSVRRWVAQKKIKSWKPGKYRFIHKSELERFKPPHD
jgi:excisionase family DNA binding protein